ncbi:hypothetical protein [Neorhizobium tomejilense]|uniref:hypothetical protein n=1 Tax=Neorhizobium tomejilense TaxID=2093828 RepID=UPI000CF85ED7|nr:hypothetical protein [Neorhizobium tomejilense]
MQGDDLKDFLISWSELVSGQATDLWTVALAFLVAQVLVIATLHASSGRSNIILFCLAYFSAGSALISMLFGYFTKGAVIAGLEDVMKPDAKMVAPTSPAFNAFVQFSSLSVSILIFVIAFGFYRREISRALLGK